MNKNDGKAGTKEKERARAVVCIPSYVGSLLRFRLLQDTLKSIAVAKDCESTELLVLLSLQCCVRDDDDSPDSFPDSLSDSLPDHAAALQARDQAFVDDPQSDLAFLDATPLSSAVSVQRLQAIFNDDGEKSAEKSAERGEKRRGVRLRCFQQEPVDQDSVFYGSTKPWSQFEHIRFLAQFISEQDVVFFSDDDDISTPQRFLRVSSLFNENAELCIVFHHIYRFCSFLLYHPPQQLLLEASSGKGEEGKRGKDDESKSDEKKAFPEYFQFVLRGASFLSILDKTKPRDSQSRWRFDMDDVRICEQFTLLMKELQKSQICDERLLVFRKAAHKRYWSAV